MSKTRNLSDLLDANGDVKSTALDNVPASNDASALTTGTLDNARLATNVSVSGDLTVDTNTLKVDSTNNRVGIKVANPQHELEIDGNALLRDSRKLYLGTSGDMAIYHDGSHSFIDEQGTGNLYIRAYGSLNLQKYTGENMIVCNADGNTYLYYDNAEKLRTVGSGVTVTGTVSATSFSGGGLGKVGQVVQSVKTDTGTTSSSSWSAISGLSADITPSSTSSKILVSFNLNVGQSNSTTAVFRLYRGTTAIGLGELAGNRLRVTGRVSPDNVHWTFPVSNEFLDSPNTTSAVGYAVYWRNNGNTVYINRNNSNNNDGSNDQSRPISNITLTEILP